MPALLNDRKRGSRAYEFSMIVEGFDRRAADFEDRLYKAGCSDALIGLVKGVIVLEFTREARSFTHALESAIRDVRKAGGRVVRVEPDSFASLSDIAERAGLTRQAVSLLVQGKRGAGDFPPPSVRVTTDSPLWDWVLVAEWLRRHGKLKDPDAVARAIATRRVNLALETERARRAA